jgi:hypothetical protein
LNAERRRRKQPALHGQRAAAAREQNEHDRAYRKEIAKASVSHRIVSVRVSH